MYTGPNPVFSKEQTTSWDNLAGKLTLGGKGSTKGGEGEGGEDEDNDMIEVDIFASRHCILKEGTLQKRSLHAIVTHTSQRECFLLNDAFLITKTPSSKLGLSIVKSENLEIKQAFKLSQLSVSDMCNTGEENKSAFEVQV